MLKLPTLLFFLAANVSVMPFALNANIQRSEEQPQYLYKILSVEDWQKSEENIHLSPADSDFIHFATEEQLSKIIAKYWHDVPEFMVLKIETEKLIGHLVYEPNPGGSTNYYHLYEGCIPRDAVVEATLIQQ